MIYGCQHGISINNNLIIFSTNTESSLNVFSKAAINYNQVQMELYNFTNILLHLVRTLFLIRQMVTCTEFTYIVIDIFQFNLTYYNWCLVPVWRL